MSGRLHITHRDDYLRGRLDGKADARNGSDYRPGARRWCGTGCARNHDDTDGERAYRLGYSDGWGEGNPCTNGTCDHLAHATT